ncbi:hypothetical protein BST61_g684 [Cercospora zeina]
MAQLPATVDQGSHLRSPSSELAALAADCTERPEKWVRIRLEEFHSSIERRYGALLEENKRLQEQHRKLKEENDRLHQERIDAVLNRESGPDFGLSLEQQRNIAQHNIDRILAQSASKLISPPPSSTTPIPPYFAGTTSSTIIIEPGLTPSSTHPTGYGLETPTHLPFRPYASSNTQPSPAPQHQKTHPEPSKDDTKSPPPKRQRTGFRPTPKCRLCYTEGKICDGNLRCQTCRSRQAARCNYDDCTYGEACPFQDCTRLHPEQKAFQNRPYSV